MYKVLIVGCGKIAGYFSDFGESNKDDNYVAAFRSNGKFELSGCVDLDQERAAKFSHSAGIPYNSDDLSKAIAKVRPDVISIATPDETHFDVTLKILEASSPLPRIIFLEKPACSDENELTTLLQRSAEVNIPIIINQSRRFSPLYQNLRASFRKERFGRLLRIDTTYYDGWCHSGVHLVDIIRYVSGLEFGNLEVVEKILDGRKKDFTYTVRGELGLEKIPVWFHGWNGNYYQIFDLDFRFSMGRLRISNFEDQVAWEEVYQNRSGERILRAQPIDLLDANESPLKNGVTAIREYLDTNRSDVLEQCLLQEIEPTMRTLWQLAHEKCK